MRALSKLEGLHYLGLSGITDVTPGGVITSLGGMRGFDTIRFGLKIWFGEGRPLDRPGTSLSNRSGAFTGAELRQLVASPAPAATLRSWQGQPPRFWR